MEPAVEGLTHVTADWKEWLPTRAWRAPERWMIDWCHFGDRPLREPFFCDSVEAALRRPFNLAFRRQTGVDALLDRQARSPGIAPTAFVFHVSRCGSTLLAQVLAGFENHIVLSEPPPIDVLLRAHYTDPAAGERQPAWIAALLSAWGQRRNGRERALVVKLDAWNIFELPSLRRACPDTPWIFLYREPMEVVASHLQAPGRHMVPGLIGASPLALPMEEATACSRAEFIARTTGKLLEAGLEHCVRHGGLAVNYDELPGAIGGRLADLLGLDAAEAASAAKGLAHHAKRRAESFEPDRERKREAVDDAVREQVERWASRPYLALEALRGEK